MKGTQPMTSTQRQRAMAKKRKAEGWKNLVVWLTPDSKKCLDAMIERHKEAGKPKSQNDIINDALVRHFRYKVSK